MEKYYLGLNMSTKAIGWALTDPDYHLLRKRGRDAWGVRLFDEANSSDERRSFRTKRRLRQREKERIGYLRKIFAGAVNAVDPDFFIRLDDSYFRAEDKEILQPNGLFADPDYTDKDYFAAYPTVYHLRSDLIHSEEPKDVRLVYLAVLNIFKHRGHFLNANLSDDDIPDFNEIYASIAEKEGSNFITSPDIEAVKEVLSSEKISNSHRYDKLAEILGIKKKMPEAEALKLMCGLKGMLSKLFPEHAFAEEFKKYSFSFRDSDYDQKDAQLQAVLDNDEYEYLTFIKQAHDWSLLESIMKGEQYISDGRIVSYEKHAADLALLKLLYNKYCKDKYDGMFRTMGECNYSSYVGSVNSNIEKTRRNPDSEKKEGLYKRLTTDITQMQKEHPDDVDISYVLDELKNGTFLPKQRSRDNHVIPYQVNLKELKRILKNAEGYLPFLRDRDDSGLTASERLEQLFAFQIPYYIGPLYNDGNHNAWVVRKASGKVFPWTLDKKVDIKASSEAFINRMVGECTYIPGEKVLPKSSLLYEKFMVLNELNKMRVNGAPISVGLKKSIYTDLFCKYKKVTLKRVRDYIVKQGYMAKEDIWEISGVNDGFNTSLTNYQKFCDVLGVKHLTHSQEQMAEKIIYWSTVYGDTQSMVRERIMESYGSTFNPDQLSRLCALRFSGWGNLSEKLLKLTGEKKYSSGDRPRTIIDRMWESNVNLMECLSDEYTYADTIQRMTIDRNKVFSEITYDDLETLYISAPVRRMLWQTILVIREIIEVMGCAPERIFIEVGSDANIVNKKQRGLLRKKRLTELYKKHKDKERDWVREISGIESSRFLSKRLYLYYSQKGRCMLTGEPIKLSELFDENLYNIDHIYPKQLVRDEDIEKNLVLVSTQANRDKGNSFPLSPQTRGRQYTFWKDLCSEGYITKEKFERLIRSTPFSVEERAGFIGMQITDTRQGTKIITNMLRKSFPGTEICHTKAGLVNDFRREFKMLRCTDVSNLYHAEDSYLNTVVGNAYYVKFTRSPLTFVREYQVDPKKHKYHMAKLFDYRIERDGETAWVPEKDGDEGSIAIIRRTIEKASPTVTMMNYTKHGRLWKQTVNSAKKAGAGYGYIPLKSSDDRLLDVAKYGAYGSFTGAYFYLVEHTDKKGKRIRTLESMPLYLVEKLSDDEDLISFCEQQLGYNAPRICVPKIKMYSLFKVDGYYVYITGRTGDRLSFRSAVELKVPADWKRYIKLIFSTPDTYQRLDENNESTGSVKITKERNQELYHYLLEKNTEGIYSKRPGALGSNMAAREEKFATLKISDQLTVLKSIIEYDSGKNTKADMTLLGGVPGAGAATISKKIDAYDEFLLISTSPAGFYRKVTDLKRI